MVDLRIRTPGVHYPLSERETMCSFATPMGCRRHRSGFSLIELIVVISIIAALAAMLLPAIGMVRRSAQSATCMSQLRQIGLAHAMYEETYEGMAPAEYAGGLKWYELLSPYTFTDGQEHTIYDASSSRNIVTCPSFKVDPGLFWKLGYAQNAYPSFPEWNGASYIESIIRAVPSINQRVFTSDSITKKSSRCLVMDYPPEYTVGASSTVALPHQKTANVLFYDLHVAKVTDATTFTATLNP